MGSSLSLRLNGSTPCSPHPFRGGGFSLLPIYVGGQGRNAGAQIARPHIAGAKRGVQSVFVPACVRGNGIRGTMPGWCAEWASTMGSRNVDGHRWGEGCRCGRPKGSRMGDGVGRPPKRRWRWDVAAHFSLTGRPTWTGLAVRRGGMWAAIVDLSGRPHWTKVGAQRGGEWATTLGLFGRPTWTGLDVDSGARWTANVGPSGHRSWATGWSGMVA